MAAKGVEKGQAPLPDMTKCSLPQLSSYVARTLLGQGLLQAAQMTTSSKLPVRSEGPDFRPMSSLVMGLSPPHSVINVGDDQQEWLTLLHSIATHRPAHLQREYTTIVVQVGDVMPVKSCPAMWETATMIRLGNYKQGEVWMEGADNLPRWTLLFALLYEPVQDLKWHCYRDASWAPEGDYSHQAVTIYLGTNLVAWQSQRQSLVALSSAEAELIASVWGKRLALSFYGQLNEMILSKPPYITYCDNSAVVQLTQQLSASKTRTRHLSMRASWLHRLVQHENVSM